MTIDRSRWKWVGLGCGGALVLLILFGAGVYFVVKMATAGPEQSAREFVDAAGAGDYGRAHGYFSAPLKESQPLADFANAVQANPSLFKIADFTFTSRSIDTTGAKLQGTATLTAGTSVPVSFGFVKENGEWKLISYRLGSEQ